jgi:hypothetical protein
VRNRFLSAAVRAGLVTGAATAGTLVGFGIGEGAPLVAFFRYGSAILGPLAARFVDGVAVSAGIAGHLAWMVAWCAGLWVLARRQRGAAVLVIALLMVLAGTWSSRTLFPSLMGALRYAALDGLQMALAVLVMVLAMAGGTAIAREG